MSRDKVITADAAAELVLAGDTLATTGFVGTGFPEELALALERRFLDTGEPRDLTLVFAAGQGDGATRGVNHFAHHGMLKRVIGGHWALVPALGALALGNRIEAYCFPPGSPPSQTQNPANCLTREFVTKLHVARGGLAQA